MCVVCNKSRDTSFLQVFTHWIHNILWKHGASEYHINANTLHFICFLLDGWFMFHRYVIHEWYQGRGMAWKSFLSRPYVPIRERLYSLSQECLVVDKNRVGTYACLVFVKWRGRSLGIISGSKQASCQIIRSS
jgi:hypothetical protein